MPQTPATAASPPAEIPDAFFRELPAPEVLRLPRAVKGTNPRVNSDFKALVLYDAIIDYMFAHPDCNIRDVAEALQRKPSTVSLVVRSDLFRARWAQRREKFVEDLNFRLASKMTGVLEQSLQRTKEALETRPNIPLPVLDQVNKTLLDRLGYEPSPRGAPQVVVQNHNAPVAQAAAAASPDAVKRAREYLAILEAQNAASGARPGNAATPFGDSAGPVVEGEVVERGDAS